MHDAAIWYIYKHKTFKYIITDSSKTQVGTFLSIYKYKDTRFHTYQTPQNFRQYFIVACVIHGTLMSLTKGKQLYPELFI